MSRVVLIPGSVFDENYHLKWVNFGWSSTGICERFHKTILQEFYQVTFRKKLYQTMEELQQDLDVWIAHYNYERTHQGKMCCGRTPIETFRDGKQIWQDKLIN
jgi:hypothetical protein